MSSACNVRIRSLDEMPSFPAFVDGDDCMFIFGTDELYPDAEAYLDRAGDNIIGLVSAHPDPELMRARQEILGVNICPMPDRRVPHINKHGLYVHAAKMFLAKNTGIERVAIVDDRWLNGAVTGQHAFRGVGIDAVSVFLERPDAKPHNPVDVALAGIQSVGARIIKGIGVDARFRPAA